MNLLDLPAFWINLDRATERAEAFEVNVLPRLARARRVPAVDGQGISDEESIAFIRRRYDRLGKEWTGKNLGPWRVRKEAAALACIRSHAKALETALSDPNVDGWLTVWEDDAVLREDLSVPPPPPGAQFVAWGGVHLLSFKADDAAYAAALDKGKPVRWKALKQEHLFYGAHCYSVTWEVAERLLLEYDREDLRLDELWNVGFASDGWCAVPQVATQGSETLSYITGKKRAVGHSNTRPAELL